ncbi:MAG: hypothetical protein QXZ12_08255 [Thermoplasmata archaeon]
MIPPDGIVEPKHESLLKRLGEISVKGYGASSFFMNISGELRDALKDHFSQWRGIFVFACMRIINVTPIKNLEFYYNEACLSEMMRDVSTYPKHIGKVLRSVGMTEKQ